MSYSLCGNIGGNTGAISCDVRRGRPVGLIFGGAVFAPSDYASSATFQAAFKLRIQRSTGVGDKLYPFPEIQGTTDQTDANKIGTLGYGLKFVLLQGKPAYEFTMIAGTTQEKAMRKFNNVTIPGFVFDDASNVWGVGDSSGNFSGAQMLVSVTGKGFDDGQNAKATVVTISYINSSDFYDDDFFAPTTFGIGDLSGLVSVALLQTVVNAANVYHIGGTISTTELGKSINPFAYFAAALASGALWVIGTGPANTPITITSVAQDATNQGWLVTLDTTMYTALAAGTKINFAWTDPATLTTAGVTGTETPAALTLIK